MEKKTNFQMVSAFNDLIGNAKGAANIDQIKKQFELILSEVNELQDAIILLGISSIQMAYSSDEHDLSNATGHRDMAITEIRDGIADVLVTTYGLAHRMGIDADADMLAVCKSNDSKFFKGSEEDAAKMCKALADDLGINVEARIAIKGSILGYNVKEFDTWAFVSADDSDPERPRGKLLKAPGYRPPVFN